MKMILTVSCVLALNFCAASDHPRLLFSKQDLSAIQARAKHPRFKAIVDNLMARADHVFKAPPLLVSLTARGEKDPQGEVKGLTAARDLQGRVLTLCMAFTLSGDSKYKNEAISQLDHALTNWKIWVDTAHPPPYDLMTGEVCATFGLAYDWLYNDLTSDERKRLREGAEKRGLDAYLAGVTKKMGWLRAHHNWNAVCNGGATLLALALEGESERSAKALEASVPAMKNYWNHLAPDGGWDEGTGYWTYGHRYGILAAEALRRCGNKYGDEVFALEGVKRTCYFPMVFNPGTKLSASFGDSTSRASDPIFYLLGREYKNADFIWAQDRAPLPAPNTTAWPYEALVLLWRPVDEAWLPEAKGNFTPQFDPVYSFPSIGWGFMAPSQPNPPFWLAFKNGSLGANHTHLDLNAISIGVNDEMLLVELGSRHYPGDYFSAKRFSYYEITTAGNNCVLVDSKGQKLGRPGKLLGPFHGEHFDEFIGIADGAYDVETPHARRSAVFVDKRYWVLLDDLEPKAPATFEQRFHTYATVIEKDSRWTFTQNGAALDVIPASLNGLSATIEKPAGWIRPVEVLSIKTAAPAKSFLAATVLYPRAASAAPAGAVLWNSTQESATLTVGGDRIEFEHNDKNEWHTKRVMLK